MLAALPICGVSRRDHGSFPPDRARDAEAAEDNDDTSGTQNVRNEFVRLLVQSDLKDITPDAVDISDLDATKEVAAQVESERRIIELERKRLRMEE